MAENFNTFMNDIIQKPECVKKQMIIKKAKNKLYHDFESPLAIPKLILYSDLLSADYHDMAQKCINGDYDF